MLSNYNVEVKGKVVYYPIYMLMFINNTEITLPTVEIKGWDLA